MRITGGEFCGRIVAVPAGLDVRPTQDRVRAALFNMLQHEIAGMRVLDLFAGSGSVGIEALSRGAASATFVERERRNVDCIRSNIASLKIAASRAVVAHLDVFAWLKSAADPAFDVVFADPPYDLYSEHGLPELLHTLSSRGIVADGGLFVAEMRVSQPAVDGIEEWDLCRDRVYGQTRLAIYRRNFSHGDVP